MYKENDKSTKIKILFYLCFFTAIPEHSCNEGTANLLTMFQLFWWRNGFSDTSTDSSFSLDKLWGKTVSWLWLTLRKRKLDSFPIFTGSIWSWFLSSLRWTRFLKLEKATGSSLISFWLRSNSLKDDVITPLHNAVGNSLILFPCRTSSDNVDSLAILHGISFNWLLAKFKHARLLICNMRASIRSSAQLLMDNLFRVLGKGFPRG